MKPALKIRATSGRFLTATPVYDTYWKFAVMRQDAFMRRLRGDPWPWVDDDVLGSHRFTNAYRASDRVSQYLIRNVIYRGSKKTDEVFFRTILFKLFNRIDTWESLCAKFGLPAWRDFSLERYSAFLTELMSAGRRVYSAAYIMPSPSFGHARKHHNHLALLCRMMLDGLPKRLTSADSLSEVFRLLRAYPSLGPFLAYQFAIDLNYSEMLNFDENDFVVAGPGARDGIRKCFSDVDGLTDAEVIGVVTERADKDLSRLGLRFTNLWGRDLKLIDCQNLFCEVGKYARVVHPEQAGESGRTRIKQRYTPAGPLAPQFYPPKWGINDAIAASERKHRPIAAGPDTQRGFGLVAVSRPSP